MARHTSIDHMAAGVRRTLRTRGYSERTVETYAGWIVDFLRYHRSPHWKDLRQGHVVRYLDYLTHERRVAPRTRNLAATSLAFLYREILGSDVVSEVPRARGPTRVPLVMSHREAMRVIGELAGRYKVAASLMYGGGLRVGEAVSIRIKDLDFELDQISVRDGKGAKDRVVPLPARLRSDLRRQVAHVQALHRSDRRRGEGWAALPGALHRKDPSAGFGFGWQFLFPASRPTTDPKVDRRGRWHLHQSSVQRQVKRAVRSSGITKNASAHTFRHSFATQMLRNGVDVRTVQRLLGHKDIRTTMIYLHAVDQIGIAVRSPLDGPLSPPSRGRDWRE